jgi:membrane protein
VIERFDAWQRRHASVALPVAIVRKFLDDRGSNLAALVAYFAFFSFFPLLLVFVSVLGFVLQDDPSLREDVVDSALARIPVVGAQLGDEIEPLTGSTAALVIGLAAALWAGLGVTLALGRAFAKISDVPRFEQRGAVGARVRGLAVLAVIGAGLIASTVFAGFTIGGRVGDGAEQAGALAGVFAVNFAALFAAFALLTGRPVRVRELLPGVTLSAVGGLLLQSLGSWYVGLAITRASDTYGTFALVIGLLSWFLLGSHLLLIAAELNVVLRRRLWPRSLAGALTPADRVALERSALAAQRDARQQIVVSFAESGADHPDRTPERPIVAAAARTEDARSPSAEREPPP